MNRKSEEIVILIFCCCWRCNTFAFIWIEIGSCVWPRFVHWHWFFDSTTITQTDGNYDHPIVSHYSLYMKFHGIVCSSVCMSICLCVCVLSLNIQRSVNRRSKSTIQFVRANWTQLFMLKYTAVKPTCFVCVCQPTIYFFFLCIFRRRRPSYIDFCNRAMLYHISTHWLISTHTHTH